MVRLVALGLMGRLVTGMNKNRGFTLIEILIVIVIIGITVGFALIAYGDFGESRNRVFFMEQLVNTLRLSQQKAILETSTLGLRIDNTSYQILKYNNENNWSPISNTGIFKATYFPKNTVIILDTHTKTPKGLPAIIINSSGDMTPFTLSFGANKDTIDTSITGTHDGRLNLNVIKAK